MDNIKGVTVHTYKFTNVRETDGLTTECKTRIFHHDLTEEEWKKVLFEAMDYVSLRWGITITRFYLCYNKLESPNDSEYYLDCLIAVGSGGVRQLVYDIVSLYLEDFISGVIGTAESRIVNDERSDIKNTAYMVVKPNTFDMEKIMQYTFELIKVFDV